MSDPGQIRRNVAVMDLLTESFEAHQRGDREATKAAIDAANECDPTVVAVVMGGILIGEVPHPEEDFGAWMEYVDAQRALLARAEAEEAPDA